MKRDEIAAMNMKRHKMILELAQGMNKVFTCKDIVAMTGIDSRNVTASLQYLLKAESLEIIGRYNDSTGWKAVYGVTGNPINREAVRKLHDKEENKRDHEPEGRLDEKIVNGVRKVRFGRDYKIGKGQSSSGLSFGFSPLAILD